MLKFNYRAKDKTGALAKGIIEATNKKQAVDILHNRQLIIISLREVKKREMAQYFSFLQKVGHNDVVNFTRQFSTMVNAGLPINEALSLLENQANPGMAKVLAEITQDVQGGKSLSESFSKHPKAFSPIYIALIKSGEAAGVLDKVLNRLADNLEKSKEFRGKGVDGLLYYESVVAAVRHGYRWAEASWVLENNDAMNRPIKLMGSEIYKRYRVYQKALR